MAEITASMVKELRERTGAGMMDCKKALLENDGNMDKAIDFLREKGIAKSVKKEGRIAAEGLIFDATAADHKTAIMVEFNTETDFASKNKEFVELGKKIAEIAIAKNIKDLDALKAAEFEAGVTVDEAVINLVAKIGEKMSLRRLAYVTTNGFVATYSHMGGSLGVIVEMTGTGTAEEIVKARDIAMHVAAMDPKYLSREQVTASDLEHEKEIAKKQLEEEGKPANIIEKIVMGKMNKYYEENCLVDQIFVKATDKETVGKYAAPLQVLSYVRYKVGEGIEKRVDNFAEEVAAQINASK